ncbi:MAG: helix-turn-helix domain-containing protein [Hominenteromicrobium sp.]
MYHENGDFGLVRMVTLLPMPQSQHLFSLHAIGWHRCNDRYCVTRPKGCETHLVLITTKGRGVLRLEGREYNLTAGTIAFIPRGLPNSYFTPANGLWEFYWLHPYGDAASHFLDVAAPMGSYLAQFEPDYEYQQRMETLMQLCTQRERGAEWLISQQLSELLHHMVIQLSRKPDQETLSVRAIRYMKNHFREPVTLDEIAQSLFVSTEHFIRAFKKETGCTPHQYLTRYRLLNAVQMLEFSDRRVEEIAEKTGFSSSGSFISNFRREYGCTPLQYREVIWGGQ